MKIHFICTKIPAHHLMNLTSDENYICERCTGKTQDVIEPCFDTIFHELKVNYDNAKSQIVELNRAHDAEREKFHKRIVEITTYYDVNADDNKKSFMKEINSKNSDIEEKSKEIDDLKSSQSDKERITETLNERFYAKVTSEVKSQLQCFEKKIDDKFNSMEVPNTILDKLNKKLDDVENKFRTICKVSEEVNENCKSYAEAVKTNSPECENKPKDFKVIVQEAMGEYERAKVIDQQNIDIRKKNIINFNAPESASSR